MPSLAFNNFENRFLLFFWEGTITFEENRILFLRTPCSMDDDLCYQICIYLLLIKMAVMYEAILSFICFRDLIFVNVLWSILLLVN